MDLFRGEIEQPANLLSDNGVARYFGVVLPLTEADSHLDTLLSDIQWRHDEAIIYGRRIITRRQVAWYANQPFEYTYSKITRQALPWTDHLLALKTLVESKTGESFNSCLLNLYHNGSEGMGWHSDAEKELKKHGAIASLSLGAERKFSFRHKQTREVVSLTLEHGSLLVMSGEIQSHWQHQLPVSKKVLQPRINLTFRTMSSG